MRKFLLMASVAAFAFAIPSFAGADPIKTGPKPGNDSGPNQNAFDSPGNQAHGPGGYQAENSQSPCNKAGGNDPTVTQSHPNNGFGNCDDPIPGYSYLTPGGLTGTEDKR